MDEEDGSDAALGGGWSDWGLCVWGGGWSDMPFAGAGCGGSGVPPVSAVEMKGRHGGVRTIVDANGVV